MNFKGFFLKANNELEGENFIPRARRITCKKCQKKVSVSQIRKNSFICPECGNYFSVRSRRRILMLCDRRSFSEMYADMESENILGFPEYDEKLSAAREKSREKEGVICGEGRIGGVRCCIFAMDAYFMMGSMGAVVGEKITRLFEYAAERSLPVIGVTVSGGARMQEGMISLFQMSKVSAAVKRHSDKGNLYVVILTNPTTGGVDASFAMLGDIHIAEKGALIGFAGKRVIEQTIKQKLPPEFQTAECLKEQGMVDIVVHRKDLKDTLANVLKILTHNK